MAFEIEIDHPGAVGGVELQIVADGDQGPEDIVGPFDTFLIGIGGQTHNFVFMFQKFHTQVFRDHPVYEGHGMKIRCFGDRLDILTVRFVNGAAAVIAHAVTRQDEGLAVGDLRVGVISGQGMGKLMGCRHDLARIDAE